MSNIKPTSYGELQYRDMMIAAMYNGYETVDRTGTGCRKIFDVTIRWGKDFPFCTNRPMGIKNAWEEMRLFLSGEHDTTSLEEKGILFWQGNTSREFLDKQGLQHLNAGSLGTAYSHQFRNAGAASHYFGRGVDQVQNLIDGLKDDPYGRRHAIDLWGVSEQDEMPLLPCWYRSSWYCNPEPDGSITLNLKLHNRSLDILIGYYQAAMQYKLFQIALCKLLGYNVGYMTTDHIDCHVYNNQILYIEELLEREYGEPGIVTLDKPVYNIDDIIALEPSDFIVDGYSPNRSTFTNPRPEMAV